MFFHIFYLLESSSFSKGVENTIEARWSRLFSSENLSVSDSKDAVENKTTASSCDSR